MKKLTVKLTFAILLFNSGLYACSCIGRNTVGQEIKYSDAVVTGRVISKNLITLVDSTAIKMFIMDSIPTKGYPYQRRVARYQLILTAIYKGKMTADTIEVYSGIGGGDCGIHFEIGKEYIVYGKKDTYFGQINNYWTFPKGKNKYWTDICSRTTIVNSKEISEIEKFKKKK